MLRTIVVYCLHSAANNALSVFVDYRRYMHLCTYILQRGVAGLESSGMLPHNLSRLFNRLTERNALRNATRNFSNRHLNRY